MKKRSIPYSFLEEISSWDIFREDKCGICESELIISCHSNENDKLIRCKNECFYFNTFEYNNKTPRVIGAYKLFGKFYSFVPQNTYRKAGGQIHFSGCYVEKLMLKKDVERRIKYLRTNYRYIAEILERG